MKFSTTNAKCSSYNVNHVIYVGTHTGSFKKLEPFQDDPYRQLNLQQIDVLNKTSKVTCMAFGNPEQTEILLGRANHYVKVFNCVNEDISSSFEAGNGEVVGLGRSNGCIVVGTTDGTVKIVKYPEPIEFSTGENLSKLRVCQEDSNLMVTGGKKLKNIIKVWDLETQKAIFTAKNVRKDMLELEQPIWENDVLFVNRSTVASCSRHGYVRVYDLRGPQRRPVQSYSAPDDLLAFTCLANHGEYLYAGTTTVGTRAFDIRKLKNHIHVYKGFTGTVTSLSVDATGSYVYSSCLDRYIRVHNAQKTAMVYQCYVKSKPTQIVCSEFHQKPTISEEDDDLIIVEQSKNDDVDSEYEDMFANMQTVDEKKALKKRKSSPEEHSQPKSKITKRKSKNI